MHVSRKSLLIALLVIPGIALAAREDADRAAALKKYGLTLSQYIEKAAAKAGGPVVFANATVSKRGKFAVHVDCVVGGKRVTVTVNGKGKVKRNKKHNRERGNEDDYAAIAAKLDRHKVTLAELVEAAEKDRKETAINAWGYLEEGRVFVRVKLVTADGETIKIRMDPRTKKPVDQE